jgi:hypothetical protein
MVERTPVLVLKWHNFTALQLITQDTWTKQVYKQKANGRQQCCNSPSALTGLEALVTVRVAGLISFCYMTHKP